MEETEHKNEEERKHTGNTKKKANIHNQQMTFMVPLFSFLFFSFLFSISLLSYYLSQFFFLISFSLRTWIDIEVSTKYYSLLNDASRHFVSFNNSLFLECFLYFLFIYIFFFLFLLDHPCYHIFNDVCIISTPQGTIETFIFGVITNLPFR